MTPGEYIATKVGGVRVDGGGRVPFGGHYTVSDADLAGRGRVYKAVREGWLRPFVNEPSKAALDDMTKSELWRRLGDAGAQDGIVYQSATRQDLINAIRSTESDE